MRRRRSAETQVCVCTGGLKNGARRNYAGDANMRLYGFLFKMDETQVCGDASMRRRKYAETQVCGRRNYASVRVGLKKIGETQLCGRRNYASLRVKSQ